MNSNPSPRDLADEALQALREAPMSPREHFEFLIQQGIIDRQGRVLVAKLFGANGDHAPQSSVPSAAAPTDPAN